MRTLLSAFAGFTLLAGVASHQASADVQVPQPQRTITVTTGQGGSMTLVLPRQADEVTHRGPSQPVAVTAGQAGSINVLVPGPSIEFLAAAKAPAKGTGGAQMTMLPTEGNN